MKVAPSNVIENPVVSVSSNREKLLNARLLGRDDGLPTSVWTPDDDDTDKFIMVEFANRVTITGVQIQGGLSPDGEEAFVTSFSFEYEVDNNWIQLPEALAANEDATNMRFVRLGSSVTTEVRHVAILLL